MDIDTGFTRRAASARQFRRRRLWLLPLLALVLTASARDPHSPVRPAESALTHALNLKEPPLLAGTAGMMLIAGIGGGGLVWLGGRGPAPERSPPRPTGRHRRRLSACPVIEAETSLSHGPVHCPGENQYRMAASLAHELGQPLTAIRAYISTLLFRASDPELHEMVLVLQQQAQRASEIVSHLRSLAEGRQPRLERAALHELIQPIMKRLATEAAEHGIELSLGCSRPQCTAMIDPVLIERVIENLLRNAICAIAQGGGGRRSVALLVRHRATELEVKVSDTGPGFPPELLGSVFEPFATRGGRGLGLGLAISREIVHAHHGRISANNRPDGGAEVRFTLPLGTE